MHPAQYSITHRAVVYFATLLLFIGGLGAYTRLGKLEDPEFTIKTAVIMTAYPGASALEVELQVTDEIEKKVQELDWLDQVRSISKAGISIVYVDIQEQYRKRHMAQIWDVLRRKVHDVESLLPPGAGRPIVYDDYGDVFGVFLALTGEGFSYAELKRHAEYLQKELVLVNDVNRVELWGTQTECVYVTVSRSRMASLGLHPAALIQTLQGQNVMLDAGRLDAGQDRIRIDAAGVFTTVEDIENLIISGPQNPELIVLRDIATIEKGYVEPPQTLMRYNGKPAIGLAISTVSGGNVVHMGTAVKQALEALMQQLPPGLEIGPVAYQGITVQRAISQFISNLCQALAIVIGILLITMGIRSGLLIGISLLGSIVGTLLIMLPLGIDLQRASLGALIIAMGMLVDNAIVVTEGSLVRLQRGESPEDAAVQPARETGGPLLGATLIAALAFLPIYLARDNTGEYCESIFLVVAISLLLSWVLAMTLNPVLCARFLRVKPALTGIDPYAGVLYRHYRRLLQACLRRRALTLGVMAALLAGAVFGFRYVDKIFFPSSDLQMFMIEHWLHEGARIEDVSRDMRLIEEHLKGYPDILSATACIGSGAPRFVLSYEPETPNPSYGVMLVTAASLEAVYSSMPGVEAFMKETFPHAEPRVRQIPLGPDARFKVEARISGPDPVVLRSLSEQVQEIMRADPTSKDTRDNWRQRVPVLSAGISQPRARRAGVERADIARSLSAFAEGITVDLFREGDELLPVIIRAPQHERLDVESLEYAPVQGSAGTGLPLAQVVTGLQPAWEDPIIHRYNRRRTITAQCDPVRGTTAHEITERIESRIHALDFPPGYSWEWGGEQKQDRDSREAVFSSLPMVMVGMALIVVALFNAFREPLIIACILPLALIGVTFGLLVSGQPFGFMALLGVLSLFGMLIKNAVVLLDQIRIESGRGLEPYAALVSASVSRFRPVMMASLTTVLGMTPLLTDRLFGAMAVVIMSGLTFASVLTLLVVPVLYSLFAAINKPQD